MAPADITGKTVIVTGGASGIGLALVNFFASHDCKIAILDISLSFTLLSSLQKEFSSAVFLYKKCDISDWDEQAAVFGKVYREFGSIDVVCANAGVSEIGNFLERDEEGGEGPRKPNLRTVDVDLVGTLYSIKLAVHYMRKNTSGQKGSIICTASNAGIYPFPMAPMYGTSKHAVVGAVRSLAKPLEADGIRINGICPNVIATGLADNNLFSSMTLTPISLAVDAVRELATNTQLMGVTAEISGNKYTFREQPEWVDEISRTNFEQFWKLGYA